MMKQQSPDFLLGYLFSEIERKIIKDMKDMTRRDNSDLLHKSDTYNAQIPLIWFGITRPNSRYETNPSVMLNLKCMCDDIAKKLDETLSDIFTKRKIHTVFFRDKQYMKFVTTAVENSRKLTVSQIENMLGYRITIIPEGTEWFLMRAFKEPAFKEMIEAKEKDNESKIDTWW